MFDFWKEKDYSIPKAEAHDRDYKFALPYSIPAVYLHYGIRQLKSEGVFQKLPKDMQQKWTHAMDAWHAVRVTKEDLDRIDNDSWTKIANKLNLKWSSKT
jgi:hypothetical protein